MKLRTTIARALILVIAVCFASAFVEARPLADKAPVVKHTSSSVPMVCAMHETTPKIEGKLMGYEFYRHDTWSQKVVVPTTPRRRPEPAPI